MKEAVKASEGVEQGEGRAGTRRKPWSRDALVLLALALALAVFLGFGLAEVYRIDGLYSYDPYYHMHVSELTGEEQSIVTSIPLYGGTQRLQYSSSLHFLATLVHEYTGISYLTIYRLLGLFCRAFAALAIFMTASYLLGDRRYGLVAAMLFLSAPYIFYRSLIGYPENLVLPFHILIFNSIVHTLREEHGDRALPLYISAALYVHYRSLVVPALILASFALFLLLRKRFRYLLALIAGTAALAAPIIRSAFEQYRSYLSGNVGTDAAWKPFTVGNPNYNVPSLDYYLSQLGVLLVLLSLVGAFVLLRRMNQENFILLMWLGFAFLLSRGKQVGLYVPTDRMMAYLCVPAALASAQAVKEMLGTTLLQGRARLTVGAALSLTLAFTLAVTPPGIRGWVGVGRERLEAAAWLNENVPDEGVIVPYGVDLFTMGVRKYGNIAARSGEVWRRAFDNPSGVRAEMRERYPGRDVYIVSEADRLTLGEAKVVYSQGKVVIYRYARD